MAGVIGVAVTGVILDRAGGASAVMGWYHAHAVCAVICLMAAVVFNAFAKGEKVFD